MTVGPDGRVTSAANVAISSTTPVGSAGGMLTGSYPNPTANSAYAFSELQVGSANGYTMIASPSSNNGGFVRFYDASGALATFIGNANSTVGMLGAYAYHSWMFTNPIACNPDMISNTTPFVAMPGSGYLATWPGGASISSGPVGGTVICGTSAPAPALGRSAVATTGPSFIPGKTTTTFFSVGGDGASAAGALRVVGTPAGWSPYTQGAYMVWNYTGGGRTDFVNNQGGGTGGWTWTNANSSGGSQVQVMTLSGNTGFSGGLTVNAPIWSVGPTSFLAFGDRSGSATYQWYATGNTAHLWNNANILDIGPNGDITTYNGITVGNGIYCGSTVGSSTTDLSHGINLWGTNQYGFNVTSFSLNAVAGTNNIGTWSTQNSPGYNNNGYLRTGVNQGGASYANVAGGFGQFGLSIGWNYTAGQGEVDFHNIWPAAGGFNFYGWANTTGPTVLIHSVLGDGDIITGGTSGSIQCGFAPGAAQSIGCGNWFRSSGQTGWYQATYGIGIYCTDSTYVRTYNNAKMAANDFVISSDVNLKTSIDDFEFRGPLRPRSFNWKSDNEHDIGFIAQEVEVLYPECVSTLRQEDGTRIKQLSYQKLSTVLAAQVNLLSDQVANLNKQIESMQSQINQLSGDLHG
jgi:hypothetical protein